MTKTFAQAEGSGVCLLRG